MNYDMFLTFFARHYPNAVPKAQSLYETTNYFTCDLDTFGLKLY